MAENLQKGFISRKAKGSGDYRRFYLEGMDLMQKLSGGVWTDYNEHDPGVTMLENLAYTLTDLQNKTELPINDLLVEAKGAPLQSGDNGFFIPSEILTTNPITANDFRKLIIDNITNVKNAWIDSESCKSKGGDFGIEGLYDVSIEMFDYPEDPIALETEVQRIKQEVKQVFHANRNLCEDIYDVNIKSPFNIRLKLSLTLRNDVNGEDVFARLYFEINDYLSHEVKFKALWQLQQESKSLNQVFDGPLLSSGFIEDSELVQAHLSVDTSDLIKIISQLDGVLSVRAFEMMHVDSDAIHQTFKSSADSKLTIPLDSAPRLFFPLDATDISFHNQNVTFHPNLDQVKKQLAYLQSKLYSSYKSVSNALNKPQIPMGTSHESRTFYPMRKQFPLIYGIGEFGLQKGLDPARYAQAKQLKAFLLPMEQVMANFLAQITHIYDLYDVHNGEVNSYFVEQLPDMDELKELIQMDQVQDSSTMKHWMNILSQLNESYDGEAIQRLNNAASNLLSRFSEYFPTYALRKIHDDSFGKHQTNSNFDEKVLQWKRRLVINYGRLSYNRTRSYDYTEPALFNNQDGDEDSNKALIPGLVLKISALLGIENVALRPLVDPILNADIRIYSKQEDRTFLGEKLGLENPFDDDSAILAIDDVLIIDENVENLRDDFYFIGAEETLLEDAIRLGSNIENFDIRQTDREKENLFYVLLQEKGSKKALVHISGDAVEAKSSVSFASDFLQKLSSDSEGIYLIEHILLAPPYHSSKFGFSFSIHLEEEKEIQFKHETLKSHRDRNTNLEAVLENMGGDNDFQFKVIGVGNDFKIRLLNKEGDSLAISDPIFNSSVEAERVTQIILRNVKSGEKGKVAKTPKYFASYGTGKEIEESFFCFKMSFILPSWPVRFQNENFRSNFESTVMENAPAHLAFSSYWIDFNEMVKFESKYYEWMSLISKSPKSEHYQSLVYDIIIKIQKFQQSSHLKTIR